MAAMTTQPTVDTTVFAEFDARQVYVASVSTPEFVANLPVTYVGHSYTAVTRGGFTADNMGVGATPRVSITGATSPGSSFVVLVCFYNETATTSNVLVAAKASWNLTHGFYVSSKTTNDLLEINGGGTGYPTIAATGVGAASTLHTLAIEFSGTTANLSMDGSTLGTVTGLTAAGAWPTGISFGNYTGTGDGSTTSRSIILGAVLGTKGSKTLNQLTANPWMIFDDGAGGADATGTGALASITLTAPAGTAAGTSGGTHGTGTGTLQSIVLTAPAGTATGTSAGAGAITTPVMKNNTGTILRNEINVIVNVYNASTGALIVQKTGQTSNDSGIVTISDALIVPATTYAYEVVLTGSRRRLPVVSAA